MSITLGWWLIPVILTLAAWFPSVRHNYDGSGYGIDVQALFLAGGAIFTTLAVWMVYFGIGWATA